MDRREDGRLQFPCRAMEVGAHHLEQPIHIEEHPVAIRGLGNAAAMQHDDIAGSKLDGLLLPRYILGDP